VKPRAKWLVAIAVASSACGRVGFEQRVVPGADAARDGSGDALPSSLIHQYSFANNLLDDLGGPPLTGLGGTLVAGGYQFGAGQGLSVTGAVPAAVYTIEVDFSFTDVVGYRKVIDFKALTSDAGLYVVDTELQFVVIPVTGCPGNDCYTSPPLLFSASTAVKVALSRDGSGNVIGYVNGSAVLSFNDGGAVGVFDGVGGGANFFVDDTVTNTEQSAGVVRRIRIYDAAVIP
jgi:hypothetical protein